MTTHNTSEEAMPAQQEPATQETPVSNPEPVVSDSAEPYSIYTRLEKWFIVGLTAYAGIYSPLTANIYFPAIPTLVDQFHKSTELINLTVTMYMIFQALSPMVFGTLADQIGRRPMFCGCMVILALTCIGLALVPTSAYWLLLLLRGIQAAGSASTIALGAGVIGDISVPAERGGFYGIYGLGPMLGPAIGPVIGGALADKLGWRSIFWFLCIGATTCLIIMILFLPETLHAIVGNGSNVPRTIIYRPVVTVIGRHSTTSNTSLRRKTPVRFQNPFLLLKNLDVFLLLFYNGIVAAVFFGVVASISTIFHETYPYLNETEIGLCFLTIGGGMIIGSTITGKLQDWDFQRVKRNLKQGTEKESSELSSDFPIEKARLRLMPYFVTVYAVCTIGYGWSIDRRTNIAAPLILLIGIGAVSISIMNASQTMLIDLAPKQSSAISACNNLMRGILGASLVAVIDIILKALGPGWTYVLLGGATLVFCPLLFVVIKIGPRNRAKRKEQESRR